MTNIKVWAYSNTKKRCSRKPYIHMYFKRTTLCVLCHKLLTWTSSFQPLKIIRFSSSLVFMKYLNRVSICVQNGTFVDRHAHNLSSVFIFSVIFTRKKKAWWVQISLDGYDVTMRVSLSPVGPSFATSKMASENGSASDIRDSWIESTMRVFIQSILITALLEV